MKILYKYAILLICLGFYQAASAAVPWIGTATYPGEVETDEFSTYDFGAGINLIKPDLPGPIVVGSTFTGYYQTMVVGHFLDGLLVPVTNLNSSGGGSGFELTLVAQFTGEYTEVTSINQNFEITGGSTNLFYDSSPDYSFVNDTGFGDGLGADVTELLSGTVTSGVGSILTQFGVGVSSFELDFSGIFGFNLAVYEPDTIGGGNALFSIKTQSAINATPIIDAVTGPGGTNSVLGVNATGGILAEADGSLQLVAVPIPTLTWLFGSFLLGIFAVSKRRTIAMR